jgi:hypothetical protein
MTAAPGSFLAIRRQWCTADGESFRRYEANRMPRTNKVRRISEANTWLRGPADPDWPCAYDACAVPRLAPEHAPRKLT